MHTFYSDDIFVIRTIHKLPCVVLLYHHDFFFHCMIPYLLFCCHFKAFRLDHGKIVCLIYICSALVLLGGESVVANVVGDDVVVFESSPSCCS